MKYTKEQIIAKAKLVMKDLEGKYYTENCIDTNINYLARELVEYGKLKGKEIPLWLIAINSLFENHDFLPALPHESFRVAFSLNIIL